VEQHQGATLLPLIAGERRGWTDRPAISEWKKRADQKKTDIVDAFGIIHDGWKLVHNTDRPGGQPEFELFEHRQDPLDLNDVAAEHPEIVARLRKQLETWHSWAQDAKLPSDAESSEGLDSGELERLRSLGYVQ
jgi:arylsulfatase A-like enzyme